MQNESYRKRAPFLLIIFSVNPISARTDMTGADAGGAEGNFTSSLPTLNDYYGIW